MMQLIWAVDEERPQHFLTCQSKSYNPGMNVATAVISPNHRFLSQSLREISKTEALRVFKNQDLRQIRSPILQVNVKQILYIVLGIASGYLWSDPRTSYSRWESWISEPSCPRYLWWLIRKLCWLVSCYSSLFFEMMALLMSPSPLHMRQVLLRFLSWYFKHRVQSSVSTPHASLYHLSLFHVPMPSPSMMTQM